jgi:hypothetical protein
MPQATARNSPGKTWRGLAPTLSLRDPGVEDEGQTGDEEEPGGKPFSFLGI